MGITGALWPVALLLLVSLSAGTLRAEEAPAFVAREASADADVLLWVDPHVSLASVERLRADLEAGLALDRNRVRLSTSDSPEPGTFVVVRRTTASNVSVSVFIDRDKHATREIDLSGVPGDGHELTIAVIAGELIRALSDAAPKKAAPPPPPPVPPPKKEEPKAKITEDPSHSAQNRLRILAGGTGSAFTGGSTWLGGAVALGWEHKRLTLEGQVGFERALTAEFSAGKIQGDLLSGELSLSLNLLAQAAWMLGPRLGLRGGSLSFRGEAIEGALGQTITGFLFVPRLGLDLGYQTNSFRLVAKVGLGATLAGVTASIDGENALSASGLEGWLGLMGGGAF